jgi:hypothetical protein
MSLVGVMVAALVGVMVGAQKSFLNVATTISTTTIGITTFSIVTQLKGFIWFNYQPKWQSA